MKRSSKIQTAELLQSKLSKLRSQLINYEHDDLDTLCQCSEAIICAYEYWVTSTKDAILCSPYQKELECWLKTIFSEQICLVLNHNNKKYSYTRKYILKKMRGISVHSDQKDRNKKDVALSKFIFEEDGKSNFEFAITSRWIITSAFITYEEGNFDSVNPFKETVGLGEKEITVTIL